MYELMKQCSECNQWKPVDDVHVPEDADGEEVVCTAGCVATDGGSDVYCDETERFVEHPDPDRFFMQIEPAEVETQVLDHDDVTFKTQVVPGGRFAFEISARYTYAGRDCTQCISLDREAAESLHQRLGKVLEVDGRE